MLQFCHGDQRLTRFLHVADWCLEGKTDLPAGTKDIKTIGVDAGHLRRIAPTVMLERVTMVLVHVLKDVRFLRRGKWILRHEFPGLHPVYLTKSADESNPDKFQPEKCEIVGLVVLTSGWKVPEVSLARAGFVLADRAGVGNAGDTALRLHVI